MRHSPSNEHYVFDCHERARSRIQRSAALSGWRHLPPEYAIPEHAPALAEAQEYCRRLARTHYENFSVASWFLPKNLRQHFFNVYAYCRISDDLGDEVGDADASLELLDQWERELDACYEASPRHPVFVALAETVHSLDIPKQPFADLLTAFRQDQRVTRYETFDDLLGYCRYSANPVGRLVLYVCGYRDAERQQLSDFTCTALQLANFWQDVSIDWAKGRVYLPLEDLRKCGVSEADIASQKNTSAFCQMMRFQVDRARDWFPAGHAPRKEGQPRTRYRHRAIQPRRPGDSQRHRAAEVRRPGASSCDFEATQTGSGGPGRIGEAPVSAAVQTAPAPFSPTPSQLAVAYSVCRSIARSAAKNFYYAFLVLPMPKRQALCAVYAYMRRCDDITDDAASTLPGTSSETCRVA